MRALPPAGALYLSVQFDLLERFGTDDAVRRFQAGEEAIGTGTQAIPASICSFQGVIPKTTDWRNHEVSYVWTAQADAQQLDTDYTVKA